MMPGTAQSGIVELAGACTAFDALALARSALLAGRYGARCASPEYLAVTALLLESAVRNGRTSIALERSSLLQELHALWQREQLQNPQAGAGAREFFARAWELLHALRPQAVFAAQACAGPDGLFSARRSDAELVAAEGRLYQRRHYDCEQELLRFAAAAQAAERDGPQLGTAALQHAAGLCAALQAAVHTEDAGPPDPGTGLHQAAAAMALLRPLTILSGCSCTAMARSVLCMVLLLLAVHGPGFRIALAAPTAQAACRLRTALIARLAGWQPPSAAPACGDGQRCAAMAWPELAEQAAQVAASALTLQSLLRTGADPHDLHAADSGRLAAAAVIITGASQLDAELGCRLVRTLRPGAHLILLGDRHQIGPERPGAALRILCASMERAGLPPALQDALGTLCAGADTQLCSAAAAGLISGCGVELSRDCQAQASPGVNALAAALQERQVTALLAAFIRHGRELSLRPWPAPPAGALPGSAAEAAAAMAELVEEALGDELGYAEHFACLQRLNPPFTITSDQEAEPVWEQLGRRCLLCAGAAGALGAAAVNAALETAFMARYALQARGGFYPGRIIMLTRSDPGRELCCGETGFIARDGRDDGRLKLFLRAAGGAAAAPGLRRLGLSRLTHHAPAFALNIPRSQGLEYQAVSIVLPLHDHGTLCAELLYTAVTRARERVILHGSPALIEAAMGGGTA